MRGAEPGVGQAAGLAAAQGAHGAGRAELQNLRVARDAVVAPAVTGEISVAGGRIVVVPERAPDHRVAAIAHRDAIPPAVRPFGLFVDSTSHHATSS